MCAVHCNHNLCSTRIYTKCENTNTRIFCKNLQNFCKYSYLYKNFTKVKSHKIISESKAADIWG